jgi:protein TonB
VGANPTVAHYLPARPLRPLGQLRWKASDPAFLLPDGLLEEGAAEAAETVYLKDGDPALASVPVEPLGPSAAKAARYGKWHAAIVASLVFHAAIVWFFVDKSRDDVLDEGSENAGLTMLGSATAQSAASEVDVTQVTLIDMVAATPVETATAEAVPVIETAESVPVEIAEPVEEMVADAPASETVVAEAPPATMPVEASALVPETVQAAPHEQQVASLVEASPPVLETAVAEVQPMTISVEVSTVLPETAQTTPRFEALPETTVAELPPLAIQIEVSTVLPETAPATPQERLFEGLPEAAVAEVLPAAIQVEALGVPAEAALASASEQPVEAIAASPTPIDESASEAVSVLPAILAVDDFAPADKTSEGLQLAQDADATDVTTAETVEAAEAVSIEPVEIVREAPEPATVSNYPGNVASTLRRALRYPLEAAGRRLKGEVLVAFTVLADGNVSRIRVVRSSGSPILDMAAVETVRRVAPFPAIPAEAARENWSLTVPLVFLRSRE